MSNLKKIFFVSGLWSLLFIPVLAVEDIPIKIRADDLKFIEGTTLVEATGSVEVSFKDATINADRLLMDSESNLATAEGHVRITQADYQAGAQTLTYNASAETSQLKDFTSRLFPTGITGPVDVAARRMSDLKEKMVGQGCEANTCGEQTPHYHVTADKLEIYPGGKLTAYNMTLFIGDLPVFWFPYYVRDDRKRERHNWVFGHNEVEGSFVKSSWDYPLGLLYLDEMEKKGYGIGTLNYYTLLGLGAGSLYLYEQAEKDTGLTNWVTKINHVVDLNPHTKLKIDQGYASTYLIPSGRVDQTTFNLNLGYSDKESRNLNLSVLDDRLAAVGKYALSLNRAAGLTSTDYNLNYDFNKTSPYWLRTAQRFSHRQALWSDQVMLNTRINLTNNVADRGAFSDEQLEPFIEIAGREKYFSWRVTGDWFWSYDGSRFVNDTRNQHIDKLPELEITPLTLGLGLFNLSSDLTYGRYREVRYVPALGTNRNYSADRTKLTLNANKSLPVGLGTVAILGAGVDQLFYSPGDQLYTYRESLSLNTNLSSFFRNDLNYRKSVSDGNSPFLFDTLGSKYHNVTERMTFYYQNYFNWATDGGFNWQTHKWFDVMTNLNFQPAQQLSLNLRTGWDIENTLYKDLVTSLTYRPYSFFALQFGSTSDLNNGQLKYGSVLYDLFCLEGQPDQWHFKLSQVFDPASGQFKVRDIMIVKALHCWELKYSYNDFNKEYSFMFTLNALPSDPVGLSTGRGFYVEGLDKQINEQLRDIKPMEGGIKRY